MTCNNLKADFQHAVCQIMSLAHPMSDHIFFNVTSKYSFCGDRSTGQDFKLHLDPASRVAHRKVVGLAPAL